MSRVNKKDMQIDFEPLARFVRGFTDQYAVRVGIFGEKNPRGVSLHDKPKKGGKAVRQVPTNAEVGVAHEFGIPGRLPARSFLRMPLELKAKEIIEQASQGADKLLANGQLVLLLKRLGVACEAVIQEAFASGGFGKWAADKPSTAKRKGSDTPLIDTAQLRRSITSKVVEA